MFSHFLFASAALLSIECHAASSQQPSFSPTVAIENVSYSFSYSYIGGNFTDLEPGPTSQAPPESSFGLTVQQLNGATKANENNVGLALGLTSLFVVICGLSIYVRKTINIQSMSS